MRMGSVIVAGGIALAGLVSGPLPSGAAARAPGSVQVIQAVPGEVVAVRVDDRAVRDQVREGTILPLTLDAGRHAVEFTPVGGGDHDARERPVPAGGSVDVVLHRPGGGGRPARGEHLHDAPQGDRPRQGTRAGGPYRDGGPGRRARRRATVFTNIANGEFAEADVPAGTHRVALFPTGGPPARSSVRSASTGAGHGDDGVRGGAAPPTGRCG